MADASLGYRTIAGFRREPVVNAPTWPAAAASAVTRMIPVHSVQVDEGVELAHNETTEHGYGLDSSDIVGILPRETWNGPIRYQGFEEYFACALGYQAKRLSGVLQPEQLATGVYRHLFEVDATLSTATPWVTADGFIGGELTPPLYRVRRATLAVYRQVSTWELLSAMVNAVTLTCSIQTGLSGQWGFVGHSRSRASIVNTATVLQALPVNSAANVLQRHGVWRLGPWSMSTALQAGDVVRPRNWQLTINNQLPQGAPGPRTGLAPEEYERSAAPTFPLSFDFARYQDDASFTRVLAATPLMADVKFTGPAIGATGFNHQLNFYFPRLRLTEVKADVSGPGTMSYTHQAVLEVPRQHSAGFPTGNHEGPLLIEIVSGESKHALLAA